MDITPCLDEKIKDFKKEYSAESIVRIDKPGEALYWFIDIYGDGFEEIFNEKCELVCVTDCECVGTFVQCDETQFDYPMVTIWEK